MNNHRKVSTGNPLTRVRAATSDLSERVRDWWFEAPRWQRWSVYGLLVLLAWTLTGWTYGGLLTDYWRLIGGQNLPFDAPALATDVRLKLLAFGLTLVSTYAYLYSYLAVKRELGLLGLALFTFLWSELLLVDLLPLPISEELIVLLLAGTAALFHAGRWSLGNHQSKGAQALGLDSQAIQTLAAILGMLLVVVPVVLGATCYLRATFEIFPPRDLGWFYVAAMLATAASTSARARL
jgi:hypothetical protein